jgi:hypothetical protein
MLSVVGEVPDGALRTVAGLDELLLEAKLSVPGPRPGLVSRTGLVERAWASGRRVVGVTAPAGYGKSTLLAQWARAEDRRVAWVSLDRFDDDPAGLLRLLAAAYAGVTPGNPGLVADSLGVMAGQLWARLIGILLALVSAVVNIAFLAANPVWSTILIAVDILVIYALTVHGKETKAEYTDYA